MLAVRNTFGTIMDDEQTLETIRRRQAKSGRVSYGDPVVLYDTSKRRIVFVPFFVPHSDHTELAIKIITYGKQPPPMDWAILEEKSLSLRETATRKLIAALHNHLAVAESA